jgi:hypothetical protein
MVTLDDDAVKNEKPTKDHDAIKLFVGQVCAYFHFMIPGYTSPFTACQSALTGTADDGSARTPVCVRRNGGGVLHDNHKRQMERGSSR